LATTIVSPGRTVLSIDAAPDGTVKPRPIRRSEINGTTTPTTAIAVITQ
jgi:hypothetical protein